MLIWETDLKIAGPTGMFGEDRDYEAMIGEPFASDLAHVFDEWTVPLNSKIPRSKPVCVNVGFHQEVGNLL